MLDVGVVQTDAGVKHTHLDQFPTEALVPQQLRAEFGHHAGAVGQQAPGAAPLLGEVPLGVVRVVVQSLGRLGGEPGRYLAFGFSQNNDDGGWGDIRKCCTVAAPFPNSFKDLI